MDKGTVLTIIEMIDNKLAHYARITGEDISYVESKECGLVDFRDHLQEFIENEISKAENQTGE
jgi:hypothetical protein